MFTLYVTLGTRCEIAMLITRYVLPEFFCQSGYPDSANDGGMRAREAWDKGH